MNYLIKPETLAPHVTTVGSTPEFTERAFHIVTGLLLPIWKKLPSDNPHVYRFTAHDGQRYIGRLIYPNDLAKFAPPEGETLTHAQAWSRVSNGATLDLDGDMTLKRVLVMHQHRIELINYQPSQLQRLKTLGLFTEIINWKTRLFIPTGDTGPAVLSCLLEKHPLLPATATR